MKIRNLFSQPAKKRNPVNHTAWGRKSSLERLEDRRVLANYYVFDSGFSIQEQIENAANNPGPDTVFILADDYFENIEIQDNAQLTVIGLGNVNLFPDDGGDIVSIVDSYNVTLNNLNVHNADDDNIDAQNTTYLTLENIEANNSDDDGLDAEDVDYVNIYNSRFNGNEENGIELINVGYAYLQDVQASSNGDKFDQFGNGLFYANGGFNGGGAIAVNGVPMGPGAPAGDLQVMGGDFSNNGNDGIRTDGIGNIVIDTIYGNNNGEDGIDVEDDSQDSLNFSLNYAATDANGDDGAELDVDYISVTNFRAVHNDNDGLELDSSVEAFIQNADLSFNGTQGLETDNVDIVNIDFIQANSNGLNSDNTGLDVSSVDVLTVNNSQFISNIGDGINVNLNPNGTATFTWVDSSDNTGDGIDLGLSEGDFAVPLNGGGFGGTATANLDGVNTSGNGRNGIRSFGLYTLNINNTSSTLNDENGLYVDGEAFFIEEEGSKDVHGSENGFFFGTDINITWSEFANNFEDGINVSNVGDVVIDQSSLTFNGDDGFDSVGETESFTEIDSIFENNFDEDIVFFNF